MDIEKTILKNEKQFCDKEGHGEYIGPVQVVCGQKFGSECPKCIEVEKKRAEVIKRKAARITVIESGMPRKHQGSKLSSYKPKGKEQGYKALKILQDYVESFEVKVMPKSEDRWFSTTIGAKSLLLLGNSGTGKTHLACSVAQELLWAEKIKSFRYVTTYDLFQEIKSSWGKRTEENERGLMKKFEELDFLIIDEIGVQYQSETEAILFFNLYNKRLSNEKPTLLISNLGKDELSQVVGKRVYDRMKMGVYLSFDWGSYRKTDMQ